MDKKSYIIEKLDYLNDKVTENTTDIRWIKKLLILDFSISLSILLLVLKLLVGGG